MKKKLKKEIKIGLAILLMMTLILGIFLSYKKKPQEKEKPNNQKETIKKPVAKKDTAKLTVVGDFLFEQPYYNAIANGEDKDLYFSLIKPYFEKDDLSIGNMEVVIGNDSLKTSGVGYNFCAPKWIGDLVATLDLEVLSTANNHAFDRGSAGVASTIDYFKNNTDIMTVGSYKEKEDLEKLNILEINNIKFGFLAYTMSTNIKPSSSEKYKISYYKEPTSNVVTNDDKEKMKTAVEKLKKEVDVVVVMMHWGYEFTYNVNETQKDLANFLNSLGVDIIVGSHSHNIQPMEWINKENKTLVYYSMGNFVAMDDSIERTNETFNNAYQVGLLSQITVEKDKNNISITEVNTEPVINYYDQNLRNFMLIPYSKYTEDYETTHKRYSKNFNKAFIDKMYETLIPAEFRKN